MLTRFLSDRLDAPAVLAGFSRLIVDPNRQLDAPSAFLELSDGIAIPDNIGLDETQKALRVQSFFKPYHDAITEKLNIFEQRGIVPALISVHTCTPVFDRIVRPWHIGIMWDKDPRISQPLIDHFNQLEEICIGDNEPYSGRHPNDFTLDHHAEPAGLPHLGIEVRQDLVSETNGAQKWADILADALEGILAEESLYRILGSIESCTA
jgi:predicted N-formylglutamate amidohydrolase